jgi:dihydrodipicolinate synthase/N-acetylneuraminate lyase
VAAALAGSDGHIDCFPNVWTDCMEIWHATAAGRLDDAWALQTIGIAMTELYTANGRTLYPATKAVMNATGLPGGGALRPPLRSLTGASLDELMSGMAQLTTQQKRVA